MSEGCRIDVELAGAPARDDAGSGPEQCRRYCRVLEGLPGNDIGAEAESVARRKVGIGGAEGIVFDVDGPPALVLMDSGNRPAAHHPAHNSALMQELLSRAERQFDRCSSVRLRAEYPSW